MTRSRRRILPRIARFLAIAALILLALAWLTPRLLEAFARSFIVEDELRPSDAVVALAGGDGERLHAAVQLYKRDLARRLLITGPDVPLLPVYTPGDSLTQGEAKRRIAVKRGIPADNIVMALGATSTLEEARTVLAACREQQWSSIIVVTSPFHTRRSRGTFRTVFRGSGIRVAMWHLPEDRTVDNPKRWWTREHDTMSVVTETVKTLFYAYNHRIFPWS